MSEPETQVEFQPEEKEPMEAEKVPTPTDGSPTFEPEVLIGQDQMVTRPGGEGGRFVCQICKKSFNSKAELDMHVESLHEATKRKIAKKKTIRNP
jgi:Zinc-finger of C2H2 type